MKKLALLSLTLWVITIGVLGFYFVRGTTVRSADQRSAVLLNAAERDMVLGEMRSILTAVNGVLRALDSGDMKEAATAARSAGMGMAVDVNPTLMAKLPLEFKALGMSLHSDFDLLAKDIDQGLDHKGVVRRLGQLTNKCVACHGAYRFSDKP